MTMTGAIARFLCPGSGQHFDTAWPCPTCTDTAERLFLFIASGAHGPNDPEEHPTRAACTCANSYSDPDCPYHESPHGDPYYVHVVPRPSVYALGQAAAQRLAREQD